MGIVDSRLNRCRLAEEATACFFSLILILPIRKPLSMKVPVIVSVKVSVIVSREP